MCRWLCYSGSPIPLDQLLLRPQRSFVNQSLHAQRSIYSTNADGFGIAWYTDDVAPGLYRDVLPAWHDDNLRDLARHIISGLFFAHVRASSGTAVQRTNCHPFRRGRILFQHNGGIEGFSRIKRALDERIDPSLYAQMEGSTDTERMFFLALTYGLAHDPPRALARMAGEIETVARSASIVDPLSMTVATSDGRRLHAVRYSSNGRSPSLYYSRSLHALRELHGRSEDLPEGSLVVLSEPLDEASEHWQPVPESTLLVAEHESVALESFRPA